MVTGVGWAWRAREACTQLKTVWSHVVWLCNPLPGRLKVLRRRLTNQLHCFQKPITVEHRVSGSVTLNLLLQKKINEGTKTETLPGIERFFSQNTYDIHEVNSYAFICSVSVHQSEEATCYSILYFFLLNLFTLSRYQEQIHWIGLGFNSTWSNSSAQTFVMGD